MPVWPYWPASLTEVLSFSTDVRMTSAGEVRDSLKDATQEFDLGHVLPHRQAETAVELFRSQPLGQWTVPVWPDRSTFLGVIAAGTTILTADTNADYRVGSMVFIGTDHATWEIATVAAIGPGTVEITSGTTQEYTGTPQKPVVIAPAVNCLFPNGLADQRNVSVTWLSLTALSVEPNDVGLNGYPLHQGLPVLTDKSPLITDLPGGAYQANQFMDSGMGAFSLESQEEYSRRMASISFLKRDPAERWAWKQWLHFLRGRDGAFWLPTWKNELPLTVAAPAAATFLTAQRLVEDASQLEGRSILIEAQTGELIPRQITSAADVADTHVLTIAAPGVALSTESRIHLMARSRLDADELVIAYQPSGLGLAASFESPIVEALA
ncbi:hypothetical protein [Halovulum sp. GXIMD14793]